MRAEAIDGSLWHVELRRPEKRNALGVEAYTLLTDVLRQIGAMPDTRAVVLSGQGECFCAGNDLAEFATHWPQLPGGPVVRFLEALYALPRPVIAAVQGAAVGIGATMLLHCDLVVAGPGAFLQYPFVDRGIIPEGAASLLLPLHLGHLRAMDLFLTGRRVLAEEALTLGLVTHVSRDRPPLDKALDLARTISAKSPEAIATTKQLVRQSLADSVMPRYEWEIENINKLLAIRPIAAAGDSKNQACKC
ncbi:enoyl-CoA hydratase/isomerase family protein [Methylobacterium sp. ID0610]|uniref:enoyl-CoA hydratase/isomerase family protein n=1 Tax=Methylobacterium carpenticola TaxID=3344827 RepID=UPI0036C82F75